MNNVEFADRLASMWKESRSKAHKSQDYVAKALGVSKKTIQNWEAGTASPNFRMVIQWFDALGVPMYPYMMSLLHPSMEGISPSFSNDQHREALSNYIAELDDRHVKELLFLAYGDHGSSPLGVIEMVTAYLHLPLSMRVSITQMIVTAYEMGSRRDFLENEDHIEPDLDQISTLYKQAMKAVCDGKDSYILREGE